jgi:hypothetical protein
LSLAKQGKASFHRFLTLASLASLAFARAKVARAKVAKGKGKKQSLYFMGF